jgi:hypothetical protein
METLVSITNQVRLGWALYVASVNKTPQSIKIYYYELILDFYNKIHYKLSESETKLFLGMCEPGLAVKKSTTFFCVNFPNFI